MLKVSIITVVFNARDFIESAIKSVLNQTYKNIEYIIIDGGSTDGTLRVIEKYKDKIAKFISEKDQGIFDGMNKGIKLANGDIVGILNSDDLYASDDIIEKVVKTFKTENCDCLWGDLVYVKRKDTNKITRYWKSSEYKKGKFRNGWMPSHPTFFVKREIYEKYGNFRLDLPIAADYEIMLRFLEKYKIKSCYLPTIMVKMREGGHSNWKDIFIVVKGNIECYRSWKANGLKINPLRIFLKPLSKISQYFKRPELDF